MCLIHLSRVRACVRGRACVGEPADHDCSSRRVLARQISGKNYTFEECLDILKVPAEMRSQIIEFGPKRWVNGELIPAVWAAKDLSVGQAASKIRNVMRE